MALETILVGSTVAVAGAALVGYRILASKVKFKSGDLKTGVSIKKNAADAGTLRKVIDPLAKDSDLPVGGGSPTTIAAPLMVNVRTAMMVFISILVLCSSLYIILSGQDDSENQKWAFGVIGSIMGFWLRPET